MSSILQKILARSSQIRALDQRWTRISLAPRLPAFTHHSFVSRSTPIPGFYKHRSSPLKKKTPIDIVSFPSTGEVTSISSKVPLDRNGIKLHKFLKEMGLSGHRVFFKLSNGFITVEGSGWQAGDKVTRTCLLTAGDTVKAVMTEASEPVLFKKVDAEKKPKFPAVGYVFFCCA